MLRKIKKIYFVLLVLLITPATLFAADYQVGINGKSDSVFFNSTAKLEFIEGQTNDITGYFSFEPDNSQSEVTGILKVDLRTLKTGIETRDEHMRENHLHTEKYPFAYFELESLTDISLLKVPDSTYKSQARGNFYIHGVYREIEAELELKRIEPLSGPESITVRAKFSINLDKYKIPRPKALFLKLAETIAVRVEFTGIETRTPESIELPDWQKLD